MTERGEWLLRPNNLTDELELARRRQDKENTLQAAGGFTKKLHPRDHHILKFKPREQR